MNLLAIYTKTAKGLRQRKSLFGGLSSQLMAVLTLVDGVANVEAILSQLGNVSEKKLEAALKQLEAEGHIKYLTDSVEVDDWGLGTGFATMVVEEIDFVEENSLDASAEERQSEIEAANKLEDERKVREIEAQIRAKEKAKADAQAQAKVIALAQEAARIEAERISHAQAEKAQQAAELKAKQEAEMFAKAKAEQNAIAQAKEQARLEAEQQRLQAEEAARIQATLEATELKAKQEAEHNAKLEADEKQRKAAEATRKAELEAQALVEKIRAKEKARREQVLLAREAAEAAKKAQAEAKAIEETRLAAEKQAQQEAEAKVKAEEQEKAIAEAKERGRLEAERVARETAEAQRKADELQRQAALEAQVKAEEEAARVALEAEEARLAAELKAKQEAKAAEEKVAAEKVAAEAKELERLEAERVAKEAEEERLVAKIQAEQEAQARAVAKENERLEKARILQEKADEKARIKAAEKAQKEAKSAEKKAQKQAKQQTRPLSSDNQDILDWEVMQVQAKRKAAKKVIRMPAFVKKMMTPSNVKKWFKKLLKFSFVYLPIVAIVLLGLMHVVPLNMLVEPIESMATKHVGEPVKVSEVRASLWPKPHFVLSNVTIGESANINIATVNVAPAISTLFDENKVLNSISFEGVDIAQNNFGLPVLSLENIAKSTQLKVEAVRFKNVKLLIREYELGTFDGSVQFDAERALGAIALKSVNQDLSAEIMPLGGEYQVQIKANKWTLPGSKIVIDEINAQGFYQENQLQLNQINGVIYRGKFNANVVLDWVNDWRATGDMNVTKINTEDMLNAFASTGSVSGYLNLNAHFASQAKTLSSLTDEVNFNARFEIPNGKINGVDLLHAIVTPTDKSLAGYSTNFDQLTGNVKVSLGQYHYQNLLLKSSKLQAQGQLDIDDNQNISGKIYASSVSTNRVFNETFNLTNKVNNVKRK